MVMESSLQTGKGLLHVAAAVLLMLIGALSQEEMQAGESQK